MNDFLKKTVIETISKSNVELKRDWGMDTYFVLGAGGKPLMEYVNGYDSGLYSLSINHKLVSSIEWYESANKPKTKEQKDMFDILHALLHRWQELQKLRDAQQSMTVTEQNLVNFLTGKNQKVI